jgi:hypothetical protein
MLGVFKLLPFLFQPGFQPLDCVEEIGWLTELERSDNEHFTEL